LQIKQIFALVPPEYRKGCLRTVLLVPFKAFLDLIGVAALLPVMMLVLDPEKLHASFLGRISDALNFTSDSSFALLVIIAVVLILVVKILLCLLILNVQNRFLMSLYRNLSSRLFISLYSRGLMYIKNQNSARMSFNVIGVCYNFVMGYLGGIMRLLGEIVFVLLLMSALLVYSPRATLMSVCAFVPVMVFYVLLVRKPLAEMSKKENEIRRDQNRLLYEAFKGYSEVQVNDVFPSIQQRFVEGLTDISRYRIRSGIISSIPSYLLELSVVVIVAVMLLFSFHSATALNAIFLGIFTVALLKLLPAIRGIISSISALNATSYTTEVIMDINTPGTFKLLHEKNVKPMTFNHEISVSNLSFQFPDDDQALFENISFSIRKGSHFGIKGRTGSGKTTLFNILLGLYPQAEGSVLIDGVPLTRDNVASWHKIIGYVPQDVFVADTTILENVALGMKPSEIDAKKAAWALEQASLYDFVKSLPNGMDTNIGESGNKISGGQRQRLGIARALYKDAQVLFFDEATSSLDVQTEKEVNDAIEKLSQQQKELTIIVISHRDSTMSFCDEILEI